MKERIQISLISSISLLLINDIFYLFNLSKFYSFLIRISDNYILNFLVLIFCLSVTFLLFSYVFYHLIIRNNKTIYYFVEGTIFYFVLFLILKNISVLPSNIDFSSLLSIYFSIIFTTYIYFYSFFYLFVVKYKRQQEE